MHKHPAPHASRLTAATAILLTMGLARGVDITGQTTDDNAKPLQGVVVTIKDVNDAATPPLATVASDVTGNYAFSLTNPSKRFYLFFFKPTYSCNFSPQTVNVLGLAVGASPVSLHSSETNGAINLGPILQLRAASATNPVVQIGHDINTLTASQQVQEASITTAAKTVLVDMALATPDPKKSLDADFRTLNDLKVKPDVLNNVRASAYQQIDPSFTPRSHMGTTGD